MQRHIELQRRCDYGKNQQNLENMRRINVDKEGNIEYDGRLYEPMPDFIDDNYHIDIPERLKHHQIEVMLRRDSYGKRTDDNIFHLGVFLGYSYDKGKYSVEFSCGSLPRDAMYNIHTFYVSEAYTFTYGDKYREEIDGGNSFRRRRRTRRSGKRGSHKRNMRPARSRRRRK
jgi:hypothetical protein